MLNSQNKISRIQKIIQELKILNPSICEVIDETYLHLDHIQTTESHFKLTIASSHFDGLSILVIHRKIHELLKKEFESGMHAISIRVVK